MTVLYFIRIILDNVSIVLPLSIYDKKIMLISICNVDPSFLNNI